MHGPDAGGATGAAAALPRRNAGESRGCSAGPRVDPLRRHCHYRRVGG
jgi:hypothetical protein